MAVSQGPSRRADDEIPSRRQKQNRQTSRRQQSKRTAAEQADDTILKWTTTKYLGEILFRLFRSTNIFAVYTCFVHLLGSLAAKPLSLWEIKFRFPRWTFQPISDAASWAMQRHSAVTIWKAASDWLEASFLLTVEFCLVTLLIDEFLKSLPPI